MSSAQTSAMSGFFLGNTKPCMNCFRIGRTHTQCLCRQHGTCRLGSMLGGLVDVANVLGSLLLCPFTWNLTALCRISHCPPLLHRPSFQLECNPFLTFLCRFVLTSGRVAVDVQRGSKRTPEALPTEEATGPGPLLLCAAVRANKHWMLACSRQSPPPLNKKT